VTLAALQQGALRETDPVVRELLNPPPPWPSPEQEAELDACYGKALGAHPGLVLHRDVLYLTRGGKVLLADVRIPEAPELQTCIQERIQGWSVPLAPSSKETILSGFFIHLGAPEALPEPPRSLTAELDRRRALLRRALELGLMQADDPMLKRFDYGRPTDSPSPHPNQTPSEH